MKDKQYIITPLVEKLEEYGKTNLTLIKLKFVDRSSDIMSALISRSILLVALLFFAFAFTVATALWLGDLLGKNYLGFLIVAIFYGILAFILLIIHPYMKERISNSLIKQALN